MNTTINSRLLDALSAKSAASSPELLLQAVGRHFHADAASLQVLLADRRLIPIAWYASSPRLQEAIEQAAVDGSLAWAREVPGTLNVPRPVRSGRPRGHGHGYLDYLAPDTWIESVALNDGGGGLEGVLTIVGSPNRGCPPLADAERIILASWCATALGAATQARRSDRLKQEVDFLVSVSRSLVSRKSIADRLKGAVAAAQKATGFDSIQLLTWDPTGHKLLLNALYIQGTGFMSDDTWDRMTREEIEESSRRFLEDPTPIMLPDPADLPDVPPHHRAWMITNNIRYLVFVPLIFEGEHLGTVVLTSHYSQEGTEERLRMLTAVGSHVASILRLSLLLAQVEEAYQRLSFSHRKTIETLALAAEMRDSTTGRHLKRLKSLSVTLGKKLGRPADELATLAYGAVVHDIGKLQIPDAVLLKPGTFTESDRRIMRTHPESGERILVQSEVPEPVCKIARWHHERWDGKGYPDGLAGEAIPVTVQIVTVADAFDAMTSVRPYKEAWSQEYALEEMKRNRGTQFAPDVVDAFLDVLPALSRGKRGDLSAAA